jgi:peroxiredoxin
MKIRTLSCFFTVVIITVISMILAPLPMQANSSSVPDFSLEQLDGSVYKLSDHIGKKIIIIDFWATWCKPCKKLLKKLNQIYLDYKQHVEVLAISIDDTSAVAKAGAYIKGKGFSFTVLLDTDSQVVRILNPPMKLPFTVIIGKKGDIVHTHTGYIPGYEKEIIKKVEKLIHE